MTASTRAPQRAGPGVTGWLAMLLICLSAALAAVLEALFVPLYAGGSLFPVAVVAALATNIAFPLLGRTVLPTMAGAGAPFVAWLVVLIGFGLVTRPEGDVILPGGNAQWVSYGVLFGGALAGTFTMVLSVPRSPEMVRRRSAYGRPPTR